MAAWNNFGIESVPDRFFPGAGTYTESDKALRRKIGLARETRKLLGQGSTLMLQFDRGGRYS